MLFDFALSILREWGFDFLKEAETVPTQPETVPLGLKRLAASPDDLCLVGGLRPYRIVDGVPWLLLEENVSPTSTTISSASTATRRPQIRMRPSNCRAF